MSSCVSFYIRGYDDKLLPIGDFYRSSKIYQYFDHRLRSHFGKLKPLSETEVLALIDYARECVRDCEQTIANLETKINLVMSAKNNSLEEKMSIVDDINADAMPDAKQELDEATGAYYWYLQLSWILSAVRYYDCDYEPKRTVNKYIYAGIDTDIDNINFDEIDNDED